MFHFFDDLINSYRYKFKSYNTALLYSLSADYLLASVQIQQFVFEALFADFADWVFLEIVELHSEKLVSVAMPEFYWAYSDAAPELKFFKIIDIIAVWSAKNETLWPIIERKSEFGDQIAYIGPKLPFDGFQTNIFDLWFWQRLHESVVRPALFIVFLNLKHIGRFQQL